MSSHCWKVKKDYGADVTHRYDIICEKCDVTAMSIDGRLPTANSLHMRDLEDCDLRVVITVLEE